MLASLLGLVGAGMLCSSPLGYSNTSKFQHQRLLIDMKPAPYRMHTAVKWGLLFLKLRDFSMQEERTGMQRVPDSLHPFPGSACSQGRMGLW